MPQLQKSYETLGFKNVATYVQSGNVVFSSEEMDLEELSQRISSRILKDFGFEVPVIVLDINKLKKIIENNPFGQYDNSDFLYVTFLSTAPVNTNQAKIEERKSDSEEIAFSDEAVYIYCPTGYGKTKLNNNFLETKLKVLATTRNWKTTNELLAIANTIEKLNTSAEASSGSIENVRDSVI
jgi:uncharacterized protein (DUF1697 family)